MSPCFSTQVVTNCTHASVPCLLHLMKFLRSDSILYTAVDIWWLSTQDLLSPPFPKYSGFHLLICTPLQSFWEACHLGLTSQNESIFSILVAYDLSPNYQDELQDSCLEFWGRIIPLSLGMEQETLIMIDKSPTTMREPGLGWSCYLWQQGRKMRRNWVLEDFPFMRPNKPPLLFKSVCSGFSVICKIKTLNWFRYI